MIVHKIGLSAVAVVLIIGSTAGSCAARQSPCASLAPPTQQEISVAATGTEVEREVGDVECDLINGVWVQEVGSSYGHGGSRGSLKTKTVTASAKATPTSRPSTRTTRKPRL